jgi:hypothetical protein
VYFRSDFFEFLTAFFGGCRTAALRPPVKPRLHRGARSPSEAMESHRCPTFGTALAGEPKEVIPALAALTLLRSAVYVPSHRRSARGRKENYPEGDTDAAARYESVQASLVENGAPLPCAGCVLRHPDGLDEARSGVPCDNLGCHRMPHIEGGKPAANLYSSLVLRTAVPHADK